MTRYELSESACASITAYSPSAQKRECRVAFRPRLLSHGNVRLGVGTAPRPASQSDDPTVRKEMAKLTPARARRCGKRCSNRALAKPLQMIASVYKLSIQLHRHGDSSLDTSEPDAAWAKQVLQDVALRATAARVSVLRLLAANIRPMSHADVVDALGNFGFDQATLFRCLNEVADAGLVARLDLGDRTRRFEFRGRGEEAESNHPYFMCIDCGGLWCLDGFKIQITPSRGPQRDKLGTITDVMIRGHCGDCDEQ